MRKLTTQEFIEKAKSLYGDRFTYESTEYLNSRSPVTITCPTHGNFSCYANNVLQGKCVCVKCKAIASDTEDFIQKAKEVHGDKYDYSKTEFINGSEKICIICPKHGEFWQSARQHLVLGYGCQKCGYEKRTKPKPKKLTREEKDILRAEQWKEYCTKFHEGKFDYSHIHSLHTLKDYVTLTCPKHGEFKVTAQGHKMYDCDKCSRESKAEKLRLTQEEFEERAKRVHYNKYQIYGEYTGMHNKIKIVCPEHGEFECEAGNHLHGNGCPKCNSSYGEQLVRSILNELNLEYKEQVKIEFNFQVKKLNFLVVDFVVTYKEKIYMIEYNGEQHYNKNVTFGNTNNPDEIFALQQRRDNILRNYCKENNINLLEIPYNESVINLDTLIKDFLHYETQK